MNKRTFLRTLGAATLTAVVKDDLWARFAGQPVDRLAEDEKFWNTLRHHYRLTPDYVNLENGYFLMQSQPVLEAFITHVREINLQASRYMRTRQFDDKNAVRTPPRHARGLLT